MTEWGTPLGAAVALFLLAGGFHALIGVLTPVAGRPNWAPNILIYSEEADRAIFGRSPQELRQEADVMKLREITLGMVSGLLVGLGLLEMVVAWFGVRSGATWAVVALAGIEVFMVLFWAVGHRLWIEVGMVGGLGALQPFQYVPVFLTVPATLLAWMGLRA
jgi:hypothetical protein